jgi:peptidoglycan hydrolase-like protein with peptidoglycan-binding domain
VSCATARPSWKRIQAALKAKGFNPGPVDGDPGKLTRAAIKRAQKKAGLPQTGTVGPRTRKYLGVCANG